MRERFENLPDAEMAAVDFSPKELGDFYQVRTPAGWQGRHREVLIMMRLAADLVQLDTAGVVKRLAAMEGQGLDEFTTESAYGSTTSDGISPSLRRSRTAYHQLGRAPGADRI